MHRDPSSPRSISGASAQYNADLFQRLNQEHPETGIQNKLEVLEPANTLLRLRKSSSTMSLKLKIPRLKSAKQKRNDSDAQFPAPHSTNLPLSSNSTFGLGRVGTRRNSSIDSTHLGSEDGIPSAINLPPRFATSIGLRNDRESAPASSRPATAPNPTSILGLDIEDKLALPDDILASVIHGSEYRKSRARRAHPTTTQDDISLDARSTINRYTKSCRHSRRASVSAATNLMSFSEFPTLSTAQTNSPCLKGDRYPNKNNIKFLTSADPEITESKSSAFISPITFNRVLLNYGPLPSGDSLPTPSLALRSSTEDMFTPTALVCTDMTFPLPRDISLHDHPKLPVRDSTSTLPSRTPSSDAGVSTSGMTSTTSLYTTSSIDNSHLQRKKPTSAELKQWRQDVDMIITSLDDEYDGEVCLMRFEPKQGWFGFWNQENISDILEDLRALRSPRS